MQNVAKDINEAVLATCHILTASCLLVEVSQDPKAPLHNVEF